MSLEMLPRQLGALVHSRPFARSTLVKLPDVLYASRPRRGQTVPTVRHQERISLREHHPIGVRFQPWIGRRLCCWVSIRARARRRATVCVQDWRTLLSNYGGYGQHVQQQRASIAGTIWGQKQVQPLACHKQRERHAGARVSN